MMMIKFRAWIFNTMRYDVWPTGQNTIGQWCKTFNKDEVDFVEGGGTAVQIMQFIGRTDKNGTEIYGGDILKDDYGRTLLVEWFNCGFTLKAVTEANFIRAHNIMQWFDGLAPHPEIIGNVFQNPDILERAAQTYTKRQYYEQN